MGGNKPDNIRKVAETLNIGLESIVFIDDSPVEIKAVKAILPEKRLGGKGPISLKQGFQCG